MMELSEAEQRLFKSMDELLKGLYEYSADSSPDPRREEQQLTLTPREYLHQHFGAKDRRWIDSLTEERCWEIAALENVRALDVEYASTMYAGTFTPEPFPGEYPNWR